MEDALYPVLSLAQSTFAHAPKTPTEKNDHGTFYAAEFTGR